MDALVHQRLDLLDTVIYNRLQQQDVHLTILAHSQHILQNSIADQHGLRPAAHINIKIADLFLHLLADLIKHLRQAILIEYQQLQRFLSLCAAGQVKAQKYKIFSLGLAVIRQHRQQSKAVYVHVDTITTFKHNTA